MNEIRCDPLTGYRVLIAEGRSARPHDYKTSHQIQSQKLCPFCEGNENKTPDEVLRFPTAEDPHRWQARIVCNKYPAISPLIRSSSAESPPTKTHGSLEANAPPLAAEGVHEVIIESPDHRIRTTELQVGHLAVVLQLTCKRLRQLCEIPALQSVQVFKNVGPAGGATIEHTHSQLIALPIVPPTLEREASATATHHRSTGACMLCDLWSQESANGSRVVAENPSFVAFCAYAGRQPGETWIVPKKHQADFTAIDESDCRRLADLLHLILDRIDTTFDVPAYNYMLHTAPLDGNSKDHYHWRLVVVPRITIRAGFEWSTGCFINPVAPRRAAEAMRRQVPIDDVPVRQQTTCDIG